jgi:hypothetical protein
MLLLSTAYFPPVEYFILLYRHKHAFIDLNETYLKQTWRNRCFILTGNGAVNLTVPVEKPEGNHTKTKEVRISNHTVWQQNHWKTILSAYRNAPYFIYYSDLIENAIINSEQILLADLNQYILNSFLQEFKAPVEITYVPDFIEPDTEADDKRFSLSPKPQHRKEKQEIIIAPYQQVFADRFGFQSNASIIDLVFNLGPDTSDYLSSMARRTDLISSDQDMRS